MGRIDSVDSGNKKNIWTSGRTFYTGSGNRTRTYDISDDQQCGSRFYKFCSERLSYGGLRTGIDQMAVIYKVVLPAAGSGILSDIILGLARAFGEALAVAMVIGQTTALPTGIFSTTKSLTTEIAAQMGNATEGGEMKTALWTMALLLFVLSLVFILLIHYFSRPKKDKE